MMSAEQRRLTQKQRLRDFTFSMFPRHVLADYGGDGDHNNIKRLNPITVAQMVDNSQALLTSNEALFPPREAPAPGKMKDRLVQIQQYARLQEKRHTPTKKDSAEHSTHIGNEEENVDRQEEAPGKSRPLGDRSVSILLPSDMLLSGSESKSLLQQLVEDEDTAPAGITGTLSDLHVFQGRRSSSSTAAQLQADSNIGRRSSVTGASRRLSASPKPVQSHQPTLSQDRQSSLLTVPPKKREVVNAHQLPVTQPTSLDTVPFEEDGGCGRGGMDELAVDVAAGGRDRSPQSPEVPVEIVLRNRTASCIDDIGGAEKLTLLAALARANQRSASAAASRNAAGHHSPGGATSSSSSAQQPTTLVCSVTQIQRVIEHEEAMRREAPVNERLGNYSFVNACGVALHVNEFPEPNEISSRTCIINSCPEIDHSDMVANIVAKLKPPSIPVICETPLLPVAHPTPTTSTKSNNASASREQRISIRPQSVRSDIALSPVGKSSSSRANSASLYLDLRARSGRCSSALSTLQQTLEDKWRGFSRLSPDVRIGVALPSVIRTSAAPVVRAEATPGRSRYFFTPDRTMTSRLQH